MAKQLSPEDFIQTFEAFPPTAQINIYEKIKTFMEEKDRERRELSDRYEKVKNGKQ